MKALNINTAIVCTIWGKMGNASVLMGTEYLNTSTSVQIPSAYPAINAIQREAKQKYCELK